MHGTDDVLRVLESRYRFRDVRTVLLLPSRQIHILRSGAGVFQVTAGLFLL